MVKASVIKPNLKHFGQFPEAEVVNPEETIWDKHYLVCVDYFNVYYVISCSERDALDELADYFEEQKYNGYFLDESEVQDYNYDELIFAGNHGRPLAIDQCVIEQL